jgi:hypothetical protein
VSTDRHLSWSPQATEKERLVPHTLLKSPLHPHVYLIEAGKRRWIPDAATLAKDYGGWAAGTLRTARTALVSAARRFRLASTSGAESVQRGRAMKVFAIASAFVALSAGAASGSTSALAAHNPRAFPDSVGDSGSGADITSVVVGNTAARLIRFEISIANTPVLLREEDFVGVFIDADRSPSTGFAEGFEYSIQTAGSVREANLYRWDGSTFVEVPTQSLTKIWEGGGKMTLQVSSADLSNTSGFSFFAATELLPGDDTFDDTAPNGVAAFTYTLSTPHIKSVRPRLAPAAPRAGRAFRVAGVTVTLETGENRTATFRCRATLGGKSLRGSGVGGCRFALPRNARGKRLVLAITATVSGQSRTLRKVFRVR